MQYLSVDKLTLSPISQYTSHMQNQTKYEHQLLFRFYWHSHFCKHVCDEGAGVNCTMHSRLSDSYGPPVVHRGPLYIYFKRNAEEPMNLIFPHKDLPLPTQQTSHSFQLHQIVLPPLPSLTPDINRKKGSLFRCRTTVIEDNAQALVTNKS